MTSCYGVVLLFIILLVILAVISNYKFDDLARLKQFWNSEAFQNPWIPTVTPEGVHESDLAPVNVTSNEKLIGSESLVPLSEQDAVANWSRMTSEKCFKIDLGERLKPVGNYLQRTNNYQRTHPDSCSAPNHEFVGTFYKPHEGVGATPPTGYPLPASTQCM